MRKILAHAILLSLTIIATPSSAQTAQEFWTQEFAKINKSNRARAVDPVSAYLIQPTTRTARAAVQQLEPRQVERNTRNIIKLPVKVLEGIDNGGRWLLKRVGRNYSGFTCLSCGREQRLMAQANGFKDCAGGDITWGWKDPKCTTPAPAGAVNSLRIWASGQHIERVVGRCEGDAANPVLVVDGNGNGGVNTFRCTTLHGATYHYNIVADGTEKPLYMQPDPCRGRGRQPRHWS
jgi:hypothetical protein